MTHSGSTSRSRSTPSSTWPATRPTGSSGPAAPLTTFLVGYAAGVRGGSQDDVADCIDIAAELAAPADDE